MDTNRTTAPAADLFDELSTLATAGGLLTFVLAPLAIPILTLVAVPMLALALVALAMTFVVAALGSPILLAVHLWRRRRTRAGPSRPGADQRRARR